MIALAVGQELSPQELVRDLVYEGYQYNLTADQPGVYAHRGEIIDVWIPQNQQVTRIRFNPSAIEHISDINATTSAVIKTLSAVNIISPDTVPLKKTTRKKQRDFSFLIDLLPGDYIVHIDHGIGKFAGLKKIVITGKEKEFFVIEYKENDKLYVPVESADRIDKYIGGGKPTLHRLSGATWMQITQKVKEDVERTAKELIALYAYRTVATALAAHHDIPEEHELADSFPYDETPDQQQAIIEVLHDLEQSTPMDRLVCGDVGFGKTEVAIRAAFKIVLSGYQVAILAPTTILAQQHYDTFSERLAPFNVSIDVLSRFRSKDQQKKTIRDLKAGTTDIVIGTHRLLSKDIAFRHLGLLIIDEEQKFGVTHKEQIKKIKTNVHVLTLSATPIPRTLHFSLAGVRDMSVISTPPEGRLPIKTIIQPYSDEPIINAIQQEKKRDGQIYYLYNKVETMPSRLKQLQELLPNISIKMAHGQMNEAQLSDIMHQFDIGEIDMLVCSTIIENGLDLPNVNTLIVEDSTKFGLAQLYQLRGRIGRGLRQAYAFFMYHRLGTNDTRITTNGSLMALTEKENKRLEALEEATELGSGFQLAMRDMEIRGVGNILGKAQHGSMRAIGLSLYGRLLAQAVEEIKSGTKSPVISDITIDLPLEYGIPEIIEPNEQKRMALYQRLAQIDSLTELAQEKIMYTTEKKDDISLLATFFDILEMKILGRALDARSITTSTIKDAHGFDQKKIIIEFRTHEYAKHIDMLLETYPQWKVGEKQIKMHITSDDWFTTLIQSLRILSPS